MTGARSCATSRSGSCAATGSGSSAPNGAGKTTLINLLTGVARARFRLGPARRQCRDGLARPGPRLARARRRPLVDALTGGGSDYVTINGERGTSSAT